MSYCDYCLKPTTHPVHVSYHDNEYGFPSNDDKVLFERLVLEIMQAGLSWETVLKKREGFYAAFHGFDINIVAAFDAGDVERLLADSGIIRNRLKVQASIYNAQIVKRLIESNGSFAAWLDEHHPLSLGDWVKLFRKTFKFTGGEIVNEFLMSLGYLPGAHDADCPVLVRIKDSQPPWARTD